VDHRRGAGQRRCDELRADQAHQRIVRSLPVSDPARGAGHVPSRGYRIPNFDEATEILAANGKTWAQYGHMKGGLRFGYVDMTAELGHYIEFMDLERGGEMHFAALEAKSNER
jgi:hypothetical protein